MAAIASYHRVNAKLQLREMDKFIRMPLEYKRHAFCRQMQALGREDALKDTEVLFSASGGTMMANSFALCLISPVLHKMLCGEFREKVSRSFVMHDVDESAFRKLAHCSSGEDVEVRDLLEAVELGKLADRLQVEVVRNVIEDMMLRMLNIETCAELLCATRCSGLRVEEKCRQMALEHWEDLTNTAGYLSMSEDDLAQFLEDGALYVVGEQAVFDATVHWMTNGAFGIRGEGLLTKIGSGVLSERYLLQELAEVLSVGSLFRELGTNHAEQQGGGGWVQPDSHALGEEPRLSGHTEFVRALCASGNRICTSSSDGTVRIWRVPSWDAEAVFCMDGDCQAFSVAWWAGHVVTGHDNGLLRVWDQTSGRCLSELQRHTARVNSLAVCGDFLLSGSRDSTINVWGKEGLGRLRHRMGLPARAGAVECIAIWGRQAVSGWGDGGIRVWDVESGELVKILLGHAACVTALAVHGRRLVSASYDGTIRAWALGTWKLLRTVVAYPPLTARHFHAQRGGGGGGAQYIQCLAASRGRLVSGTCSCVSPGSSEVKVWELEELRCEQTIPLPSGLHVGSLVAACGEVWAGVGKDVVVLRERSLGQRITNARVGASDSRSPCVRASKVAYQPPSASAENVNCSRQGPASHTGPGAAWRRISAARA